MEKDRETDWTPESLRDLAGSYRLPMVLLALVRIGALERLAVQSRTAEALARECGADAEALARALDVLVSVGILARDGEMYDLGKGLESAIRGGRGGAGAAGIIDGLRHTADGLGKWMRIEDVLRAGRADYPEGEDVTADPERNDHFIRAMHAFAGPVAERFVRIVPREGARTFLDLGGGPGTFCFALLDAWPDLAASLADLPLTLRVTRRMVDERGLADRMRLVEADFYRDRGCDLGGPYDLVLLSAVMHAEGQEPNRDLLRRVREVVAPGGRIVVRENLLAEDRKGPPRATLFDVHMLVSTRRGRCYTLREVCSMLEGAGFHEPRLAGSFDDGLVVACL